MSSDPPPTFAALLRRHRLAKGLTQEELAERAQLSVQAIGALERGDRKAPRRDTVDLLASALALTSDERTSFADAARQRQAPSAPIDAPANLPEAPRTPGDFPPASQPSSALRDVIHSALTWVAASLRALTLPPTPTWLRGHSKVIGGMLGLLVVLTSLLAGSHALHSDSTICLATDFPTSGRYAATRTVDRAVNLAVAQSQQIGNGYTLKVINYDDTSPVTRDFDPDIGRRNVQAMVSNPCVVGMVGPGNSLAAVAEMPVAANAGLAMISPSTTRSGLTLRPYAELEGWDFDQMHPAGKPLTFFRIVCNDAAQGLVAASFLFDDLGARNTYVVTDRERFGVDVVGSFTQGYELKGGKIAAIESIESINPSEIAATAARIMSVKPDAVFFSGTTPDGGGLLKADLFADGYTGPFVGGEGIASDPGFIVEAGYQGSNGALAIDPAEHLSAASSGAAARLLRDFHTRYPNATFDAGTAESYDAAMVLITAIKRVILSGQPVTRETVDQQVQHIHYEGVNGLISFDTNGDIAHGIFTIERVQDGSWTSIKQVRL